MLLNVKLTNISVEYSTALFV